MNIISYLKCLIYPFGTLLILPILLSIGNLIGLSTINYIILIIMSISMIISGYLLGKKSDKRGYIKGLIFGLIFVLLLFLISLLLNNNYSLHTLLYYMILIASSTVGSMLGIQKNSRN